MPKAILNSFGKRETNGISGDVIKVEARVIELESKCRVRKGRRLVGMALL